MKDCYIIELDKLLTESAIENKDSILSKYRDFWDLGLEAGMSDQDILQKLGSPSDVVSKYEINEKNATDDINDKLDKKIDFNVSTISDSINIMVKNVDEASVAFRNIDEKDYKITKTKESFSIKFVGKHKRLIRKGGTVDITLPKKLKLNDVLISILSGEINIDKLNFNKGEFKSVSGEIVAKEIIADKVNFSMTSGDVNIGSIASNSLAIRIVSGDCRIDQLKTENLAINSISGSVNILDASCKSKKISSLTGEVYLNGEKYSKSISEIVGGIKI